MRFSSLLLIVTYGILAVVLFLFSNGGGTVIFDGLSLALAVVLMLTVSGIVLAVRRSGAPLELVLVMYTLLFFGPPLLAYQLYPGVLPLGSRYLVPLIVAEHTNRALIYTIIGHVLVLAGLAAGRFVAAPRDGYRRVAPLRIAPRHLIAVYFLMMLGELAIGLSVGSYSTVKVEGAVSGKLLLFSRFFSSDTVIYVAIVVASYYWSTYTKWQRRVLAAAVLVATVYRTVTGTRQIILMLSLVLAMSLIAARGDFRIPGRFITLGLILAPLSLVAFGAATQVRAYWDMSQRQGHLLRPGEFIAAMLEADDSGRDQESLLSKLYPIFFRLNGLDPAAIILSDTGTDTHTYVNPANDVKSFVNVIVPGTPFPEAVEPSKTFLVVYRGYPREYLNYYYVTTMWTLWGYTYADFGWWGGMAALFLIGGILSVGYCLLTRWHSPYAPFYRLWWLLSAYYLYASFGYDTDLATSVEVLLPLCTTLAVLTLLTKWSRAPRRRRRAVVPARHLPAMAAAGARPRS
jgi:hypothetical protein